MVVVNAHTSSGPDFARASIDFLINGAVNGKMHFRPDTVGMKSGEKVATKTLSKAFAWTQ